MTARFDPYDLLPEASLNQTLVPTYGGVPAIELLGAPALAVVDDVSEVGRRLGALVATLVDPSSRTGTTDWRRDYLAYWAGVEEICLGGGNAARFGADLGVTTATALADDHGVAGIRVGVPADATHLALLGAARTTPGPAEHRAAAVLDFGHSWVKRGVAHFDPSAAGAVTALELLEPIEVDPRDGDVLRFVDAAIAATVSGTGDTASAVSCAVAAYVTSTGVVADRRSYYAPLHGRTGIHFIHDGTAAASAVDTTARRAAVIVLGTALGVGFVTDRRRRPIRRDAHSVS